MPTLGRTQALRGFCVAGPLQTVNGVAISNGVEALRLLRQRARAPHYIDEQGLPKAIIANPPSERLEFMVSVLLQVGVGEAVRDMDW